MRKKDRRSKMASLKGRLMWTNDATLKLIELWSERTIQFSLSNCKTSRESSEVYKSLQMQLHANGFEGFSVKEVINEMKKLRQKYKKEKDKGRISGNGSTRKWKYFSKMDNILSAHHNVEPPVVVDTMAENKEDTSVVNELVQKYGEGTVRLQQCETPGCTYEEELHSSGVHVTKGGSLKVYYEEDDFSCPNCNKDLPNDVDEVGGANDSVTVTDDESTTTTKPCIKPKIVKKQKRKTNVEKSLDAVFNKFYESSNAEFLRFQQLEEDRFKREQEFRIQQRREEREHELKMMQLLLGSQTSMLNTMPAFQYPNYPVSHVPYSESPQSHHFSTPSTSTNSTCSDDNAYFQL